MRIRSSVYVIAEAGVNHDGDEQRAYELIDIAREAGADAVKFQLFDPQALVTANAVTASYQAKNLKNTSVSQRDMLRKLTLPREAFVRIADYCAQKKIDFLCTPFDEESLHWLTRHTKMGYLKLASGEVTNGPLLLAAAKTRLPIILSTGMSDLKEIADALRIIHFGRTRAKGYPRATGKAPGKTQLTALKGEVSLLHCVSQYPASIGAMNLRAMESMRETFSLPVGLSDHSAGTAMSIAACALGATLIEKHFTYDNNASGPDHAASLDKTELKAMIVGIRDVEIGLGDDKKRCQKEEENTKSVARRSVVAARDIAKGTVFTEALLTCKRPSGGLAPSHLWTLLGKRARRGYAADSPIHRDEIES